MARNILVVEDDPTYLKLLMNIVRGKGYKCICAATGESGLLLTENYPVNGIILDLNLPDGSGLELLPHLPKRDDPPTVVVVTARDQVSDRIAGLDAGADDYLVKPFAFSELVARIEVLLRRAAGTAPAPDALVLCLGDLQVDLARRRATRAGQRIDLSAKEFQLLTLLLRRKGEVLSRTEIAEQVWDVNFDHGTNVIDVAVRRLRSKLDLPFERPLLHTVRGMGYVLEDRQP